MSFIDTTLKPIFPNKEFLKDDKGIIKVEISVDELMTVVLRLHNEGHFESLQTITCTDWIEEGLLYLNYIMYSYTYNQTIFVSIKIDRTLKDDGSKRTVATIPSLETIWPQSNHFERELWEMFGISITGHSNLKEFFLEDWQDLPPLRRDFDTLEFVNEHFDFRKGREDAKDVPTERKRIREEKLAKKETSETSRESDND